MEQAGVGARNHQFGQLLVHQARVEGALPDFRGADEVLQEGDVGGHALDPEGAERPVGLGQHFLGRAAGPGRDQLGEEGVEALRGRVAGVAEGIDADAGSARRIEHGEGAARRQHAAVLRHALEVDAHLHGVAPRLGRVRQADLREGAAGGEFELREDEVDAGYFLRDRVLHLQARVRLHERERGLRAERLAVHQELEGAGVAVADPPGELDRRGADPVAERARQAGGGGELDELLVAPLDAAVAFPEMHGLGPVTEDLHLYVAGARQQFLDVERAVAERRGGLGTATLERGGQCAGVCDGADAPAAAARDGLDHERAVTLEERLRRPEVGVGVGPRQDRYARVCRRPPRRGLVAEQGQGLGLGADEDDTGRGALGGEAGVLAQEAVTGVQRVATGAARDLDQPRAVEIGARARGFERHGIVGGADMQGRGIFARVHGDAGCAVFGDRAHQANRDLAAVGHEDPGNHRGAATPR